MPVAHLTDISVSRLKESGTYFDKSTPAFGIRVLKNRKTWIVIRGRERTRTRIGHYPVMSLADARQQAKKLLTEPLTKTSRLTFSEAFELFKVAIETKKPRTQRDYKRHLGKYFVPVLGAKKLPEITYENVIDCVDGVSFGERNHALAVARIIFRWCVKPPRRFIPHSPLEGVEVKPSKKRKRVLKPEELKPVWIAAGEQGYPHGTVVQLLILSGQRRGEVGGLRWPWINQNERTITLPEEVTKNRKEHTFPYGDMTAAILETIPRRNTTDLLFPSRVSDDRPISGWSKLKKELNDGVEGWRLHDLRRTMRTTHAKLGTPAHIGERLINHVAAVTTEVEQIYDVWTYMPEMRRAVETYEAHLSQVLARK